MKKLAIFGEGLTESLFAQSLVLNLTKTHRLHIERWLATGGRQESRSFAAIHITELKSGAEFYIQILNSAGEERVASEIRENYTSLVAQGFRTIIGIRDVYPKFRRAEIAKLRTGLQSYINTGSAKVIFVLGVMEIEAWFLSEYTHFRQIHSKITLNRVKASFGFDPRTQDMQLRNHPSQDLSNIYWLEQREYSKSKACIERTLHALNFLSLRLRIANKFPDLLTLIQALDRFLTVPAIHLSKGKR